MRNNRDIRIVLIQLVFLFSIECASDSRGGCSTFNKTQATIKIHGKYQNVDLSGCLEDSTVEGVWITGCVKGIHTGTFKNMEKLKDLVIQAGSLETISPNFTTNTPILKHISINKNALTRIGKEVLPRIPLLKLNLASNKIHSIDEDAFKDITIHTLILEDNKIKNIESAWFRNTKINNIFLGQNQIRYVKWDAFKGIKGLKEINLSNNLINYIDKTTFSHLKSLKHLNLTGNILTHLNFLSDVKLTKMDVGFNRISYIFLDNSTSIQFFFVFPNPWQCTCLQEFWKYAVVHKIGVGNTPSIKSTWKDVYPVCVAQNAECTKKENYDEIRMQYFKNVNYAKLDN